MSEIPKEIQQALTPAFDAVDEFEDRLCGSDTDLHAAIQKHNAKRLIPRTHFLFGRRAPRA